jgi:cell division protein FtsN
MHGSRRGGFGGTLVGIFIGIVIGVGLAAAVAYYVMRSGNPYQTSLAGSSSREPARAEGKGGRAADAPAERPRFDFYKILPGVEEPRVQPKAAPADKAAAERPAAPPDKAVAKLEDRPVAGDKAAKAAEHAPEKAPEPPPRAPRSTERIWLQAGSFSTEADAENLKAKLALSGLEATLQTATLPDKSVRYRVRLGPYDNVDEVNRVKGDLARRGFDAAVIR